MNQLENEYPNMRFIYMTGHLDGTGSSGNLHQRNEQIRASEYWIKTYFTDDRNLLQKNTLNVINQNKKEIDKFYEKLIMDREKGEDNDTTVSYK